MKLLEGVPIIATLPSFSILERIDVGETPERQLAVVDGAPFSILERIDVGETDRRVLLVCAAGAFSILERIDVGETVLQDTRRPVVFDFQYPRTDRRG